MGLYFFLVFDQADETVLGRRGLAMSNPQSMCVGATRRTDTFEVVVGRDIIKAHLRGDSSAFKPRVAFGTVYNFVTVTHEFVGEIHIQFSNAAQSYDGPIYSTIAQQSAGTINQSILNP